MSKKLCQKYSKVINKMNPTQNNPDNIILITMMIKTPFFRGIPLSTMLRRDALGQSKKKNSKKKDTGP